MKMLVIINNSMFILIVRDYNIKVVVCNDTR